MLVMFTYIAAWVYLYNYSVLNFLVDVDSFDYGSITSKLKIFNKNYKGLGTTEKEKKRGDTDGTIILFLIP